MVEGEKPRWAWWRAHELRINLALVVVLLVLLIVGIVLNEGIIAGPSFLLLIFFLTYSLYAYLRRDH